MKMKEFKSPGEESVIDWSNILFSHFDFCFKNNIGIFDLRWSLFVADFFRALRSSFIGKNSPLYLHSFRSFMNAALSDRETYEDQIEEMEYFYQVFIDLAEKEHLLKKTDSRSFPL